MSCHWVGCLKMNPISVDKIFKRNVFKYETDSTLKDNEQT